jgi:uncharacterized protein YjbI with pentapeptide repeats
VFRQDDTGSSGSGFESTSAAVLASAVALAGTCVLVAVSAALSNNDAVRWVAVFGVVLCVLVAGLTLWTPDLRKAEDREKVGLALLAASLFFGTGSFMALQDERVAARTGLEQTEAERGFELAAEKRRLIVELGVRKNLSGIDLRQRDVSGAALRGRRLSRALLNGANMQSTDLSGANLRAATLYRTRLGGATLRNADVRGATLTLARLQGADLRGADLRGTTGVESANLRGAVADAGTRWPRIDGFGPRSAGVVCVAGDCGTAPVVDGRG